MTCGISCNTPGSPIGCRSTEHGGVADTTYSGELRKVRCNLVTGIFEDSVERRRLKDHVVNRHVYHVHLVLSESAGFVLHMCELAR